MKHTMIHYDLFLGQESLQLQYMDTDSVVLTVNTKDINKDFKNPKTLSDFSNLSENHELSCEKKTEK